MITLPFDQWSVRIEEAHEGYICWEEYLENQQIMHANARSFLGEAEQVPSPRRGHALLQSRVLCGNCGYRTQILYRNWALVTLHREIVP